MAKISLDGENRGPVGPTFADEKRATSGPKFARSRREHGWLLQGADNWKADGPWRKKRVKKSSGQKKGNEKT